MRIRKDLMKLHQRANLSVIVGKLALTALQKVVTLGIVILKLINTQFQHECRKI